MRSVVEYFIGCVLCVIVSAVLAAPVAKPNYDQLKAVLRTQLKEQENALETLAEETVPKAVEFAKSSSYAYSNINGAEQETAKSEQKVSEPEVQHVISDAKEQYHAEKASPEAKPIEDFKATLDIPDEGIHKEVSNDDVEDELKQELDKEAENEPLEFTPKVVAEYLYRTGEAQDFQSLLNDLVEASEITSEEAEQYEMAVMSELYKLEQQQPNNVPANDALYPQGFDVEDQQPVFPIYGGLPTQNDLYPLYGGFGAPQTGAVPAPLKLSSEEESYINYLLNKPVTLDDMINQLLNQWLNRAIQTGDPEAEEILNNIVDFVSQDDNPNDEAQVKAILGDIFAEALLEDLSPRVEPEEIQLGAGNFPATQLDSIEGANDEESELEDIFGENKTDAEQKAETDMTKTEEAKESNDITVNEADKPDENAKM